MAVPKFFLLLCLIIYSRIGSLYPVNAQTASLQKTIRATNIQHTMTTRPDLRGGNMIFGIPDAPNHLVGNYYLDNKWNMASLMLYKNEEILLDQWVRYNIASNYFEILSQKDGTVKTIPGLRVHNLVWVDSLHRVPRYFINGMDLKEIGAPVTGFYEVLVDGELSLLRRTIATVKKSNYNTALMIGNKNDEIKKRDVYYYIQNDQVIEVPRNHKKLIQLFEEDKQKQLARYIKENNPNKKEVSGLYRVFSYYNSLFENADPIPQID
ncbi:hypothetical protein [Anditalea andensis]|uniref:Uncharacterized protein n=1 Tax=Anditalea andensis TaxID=1048983 RepID=A0A074L546_9BACT|nr:hypothetical protein [Anditalea andensis]KEO74963.1 hypothetical protein EL17_04610 [Anditalea andensis]